MSLTAINVKTAIADILRQTLIVADALAVGETLSEIALITPTDEVIIVGNGTDWVGESVSDVLARYGEIVGASATVTSATLPFFRMANSTTALTGASEVLGEVQFYSSDASTNNTGVFAKIQATATDTAEGWGANAARTDMRFFTASSGTMSQQAMIANNGRFGIGVGQVASANIAAQLHVVKTTEQARFGYDLTSYASLTVGATGQMVATATGDGWSFSKSVYIGDTANANQTLGLTLNQGGADNEIATYKSSDIDHGLVSVTETDTYGYFQKSGAGFGGLQITGLAEGAGGVVSMRFRAYGGGTGAAWTSTATTSQGVFQFLAINHDRLNALTNWAASTNIVAIRESVSGVDTTRWLLKTGGQTWQSAGAVFGGVAFPTTGTNCVTIGSGTAPTAVAADSFTIYSSDLSAGNTIPSIWTEGTGIYVAGGAVTGEGTCAMRINGTVRYFVTKDTPAA